MQDLPDFDNFLQDPGNHHDRRKHRSGIDPIPEFDRAETVTLEIEVLQETYDQLLAAIISNEWEREEGLRTILFTGLGFLDGKLAFDEINRGSVEGGEAGAKRIDDMIRDLAAYHSMYSVMKFKAFKLYKINQALEFNVSGLRATERMWEGWADRMRRQHAELQAECIRLRSLMSEFDLEWDKPAPEILRLSPVEPEQTITTPLQLRSVLSSQPQPRLDDVPEHSGNAPEHKRTLWERLKAFLSGQ